MKLQKMTQPTFTVMHLFLAALFGGAVAYLLLTGAFMDKKKVETHDMKMPSHGMDMSMSGMTDELQGLEGKDFDKRFLELMYDHHQGALDMAVLALDQAEAPEIKTMAQNIINGQTAEMEDMKTWYMDWRFGQLGGSAMRPHHIVISWEKAQELLQACKVETAVETHTAGYQFTLKDGALNIVKDKIASEAVWDKVNTANTRCGGNIGIVME